MASATRSRSSCRRPGRTRSSNLRWGFYLGGFLLLGRAQAARDDEPRLPATAVQIT